MSRFLALRTQAAELWTRYERSISIATVAIGFSFDLWLAKSPESVADNVLLLGYLLLAAGLIVSLSRYAVAEGHIKHPAFRTLLLQFCFGGLASNLLILYGKSGTLAGSAIFLVILGAFLAGNEFLKSRYAKTQFNVAVYAVLLLTYLLIALPTFVLHTIGAKTFLLTLALSSGVVGSLLAGLYVFAFQKKHLRTLLETAAGVIALYALFAVLYFTNNIPPVPVSLAHIGIYHSVEKTVDGAYAVSFEKTPRYVFWRDTSATYHVSPGEGAYCFSAIFAPTSLGAPVQHRWEYYYDETGNWLTVGVVRFPITGGREAGYRGFSRKSNLPAGKWRCNVETAEGQLIGRISFTVVNAAPSVLSTTKL